MKTCLIVLLVFFLLPTAVWADGIKKVDQPQGIPSFLGYVPDRLIVVMKSDLGELDLQLNSRAVVHIGEPEFDRISDRFAVSSIKRQFVGSQLKSAELARYYKVSFDAGTLDEAMQAYRSHPMVEKVEPIGIHAMYATPNDFYYSYQWHLNQASDHDIDAPEAWDIEAGADATIVAILDSGTRYYHPDLGGVNASPSNPGASRGNMWINTAELNGSGGVDDDGNGYVDDWIGYDFIQSTTNCWSGEDCGTKDNDPRDFNGHGTHTSGIFGMITNDGYGMCGVAGGWGNGTQTEYGNGVRIMALRMGYSYNYYGQEYGVVLMDAAAEAFYYAADNGAHIASCSWGSSNSGGIGAAATYFLNSGGIICVAAGNDGAEVSPDYLNGRGDCISVAATDENDNGASFTTYGTWVDICAPGNNIYSTYHDHYDPGTNYWASMGGTSMATPMVAGVCALIWSRHPDWTASQVESRLYATADNIDAYLSSKYIGKMGAGRINAFNAVNDGGIPPVANFSGTPTSGCVPLTVSFTDLSSNDPTSWSWDFGDLGTSSAQNPNHTYTSAGTYTVTLTATNAYGSDDEVKTGYITVIDVPTAGFTGSPRSGEVPLTVNFTNTSSGAASYSWDFGDTGGSTQTNPSHTYTEAGTYTVVLTATNACGSDIHTEPDYITVTCTPPVAGFVGSPTSGEAPLAVNFTDQSTGATSWSWDFGDTQTSSQQSPTHEYTDAGTYTVTLTATNSCGSDDEVKTDYITVTCTPPVADFVGSPTSGDYPLTVNFTDMSTGATSWQWDFGDTETSTAQNPSHTYTGEGFYTVTLTVTNSCGSDDEVKTDYIEVTEPSEDYASLPYSTGFESGSFDQYWFTQSSNSEGRILITSANGPHSGSYHMTMDDNYNGGQYAQNEAWLRLNLAGKGDVELAFWWKEFSDETHTQDGVYFSDNGGSGFVKVYSLTGGTSTYQEIVLDVDALAVSSGLSLTGTFVVKFQQYDNYSITTDGMAFDDISVTELGPPPPVAAFSGSPTSGCAPLTVDFTDESTGDVTTWDWDFGDGTPHSGDQNPSHQYANPGDYTVTLTVTGPTGSDDEVKNDYIQAEGPPVAGFYGDPTSGVVPLTVDFHDQSTGTVTSWDWDFGDGTPHSSAQNPTHEYTAIGFYTVTLTVTGPCGSDGETKADYITVAEAGEDVMHVHSIEVSRQSFWRWARGIATVTIYDQGGAPVSDATVYGVFSGPSSGSVNGNTNGNGQVTFYTGYVRSPSGEWCFEVTDVTKSNWTYDPGANEVTEACESGPVAKLAGVTPDQFRLSQNYPNPFNPVTRFTLDLVEQTRVSVVVYNIAGQKVKTLVDGVMSAGSHTLTWDGTNDRGEVLSSGIYFYRAVAADEMVTRKMTLLK